MNPLSSLRALPSLAATTLTPRVVQTPAAAPIRAGELSDLPATARTTATPDARSADGSFSGMLGRLVSEVNAKQNAASQAVADLQSGRPVTLHQAMISMEEASVSFQLMAEVRNRLLESYQELMRMQV